MLNVGDILFYSPKPGFVIPVHIIDFDSNPDSGNRSWVWIDVPVGYAVCVGEKVFETLQKAFENCENITKKESKRRHKKVENSLKRRRNWIVSTGNNHAKNLPLLGDRRVYVKTGKTFSNKRKIHDSKTRK